ALPIFSKSSFLSIPSVNMEKSNQSSSVINDDTSISLKNTIDPTAPTAVLASDAEKQQCSPCGSPANESAFKGLGILDRFLAVWILLAMAIGIILGNFVPNTGPALEKGKFVDVSVPIGNHPFLASF